MRIKQKWYSALIAIALTIALLVVPTAASAATADSPWQSFWNLQEPTVTGETEVVGPWTRSFLEELGLRFDDFSSLWLRLQQTRETPPDMFFGTPGGTFQFEWQPIPTYSPGPTRTPLPALMATPTHTSSPSTTLSLQIISVTSPVSPGDDATLVAKTVPGAECDITVYLKSGPSTASGLYPKTADSSGRVSWTWKVGTRTTAGSWRIVVTATHNGKTVFRETYFTVRADGMGLWAEEEDRDSRETLPQTSPATQAEGKYVGSIKSVVYHYPSCRYAQQIHPENERWFSSAKEALNAGYRPCEVCKPPRVD